MLKIFTNTQFLTEAHRREVFPLLFDLHFLKSEKLKNYFVIVNTVETSDVVVLPINYTSFVKNISAINNLLKQAKEHSRPLWIYTSGDFGFTNYIPNSYSFRLGGFNSQLNENSFIIPSFINDPYLILKQGFSEVKKEVQPSIGFVGHAQSGLTKYFKEWFNHFKGTIKRVFRNKLVDTQPFYPSSIKRANYLNLLSNDKRLNTNFMLRNNYRAGVQTETAKQKTTQEFYKNMYNCAYTFCSRGVGNFSVRFYETLAMGRIPILLNTDCRLPLEETIDWKQHCIIIEENEAEKMPEIILEFHNSKTGDAFLEFQKSNRLLWENKLARDQYFIAIHDLFIKKLKINE